MPYEQGYGSSSYNDGQCVEADCPHRGIFRGRCQRHHVALGEQGRLLAYVDKDPGSGCWIWNGPTVHGYGQRSMRDENGVKRTVHVHRQAYIWWVGPIPDRYQIDHLCRVTRCLNPEHLEAVTPQTNTLRSSAPSAVANLANTCTRGHEYTAANTRWRGKKRWCRACMRAWAYEKRTGNPHPARQEAEARLTWTGTSRRIVEIARGGAS